MSDTQSRAEGLLAVMILMARADGYLDQDELNKLAQLAQSRPEFAGVDQRRTEAMADEFIEMAGGGIAREELLGFVRAKLPEQEDRDTAVRLALEILESDDHVAEAETEFLQELLEHLNVSPRVVIDAGIQEMRKRAEREAGESVDVDLDFEA